MAKKFTSEAEADATTGDIDGSQGESLWNASWGKEVDRYSYQRPTVLLSYRPHQSEHETAISLVEIETDRKFFCWNLSSPEEEKVRNQPRL